MVGWHHRLDGYEFEQALEVGDGQGSLAYCSPEGRKVLDMTEHSIGIVKAMVFPVVMYNCESWTIKKAKH